MELVFINAAIGFAMGAGLGLCLAIFTRDGVWPGVWAALILGLTVLGGVFGALEWVLS